MIGNYIFINRAREKLVDGTMGPLAVFVYFLIVTVFDGLQLIILQVSPAPTNQYASMSAWGSGLIGLTSIVMCFIVNGAAEGKRFLERYFTLCAVIGLWVVVPLQILLALPSYSSTAASIDWLVPVIILSANLMIFSFLVFQFVLISKSDVDAKSLDKVS